MSEKRFTVESTMVRECILDNASGEQLDTFDYTERLCDLLNEQQSTISQLQDLCGESDGENAKLRLKNKELQEMNEQLREINKEIGDDLHNCRINKNIIREKLKLWQDVHKEYDIYSIKDFEKLMKKVKQKQ